MNNEKGQTMSDLQLLGLVQERHGRAIAYPRSKPMHDAWLEAKNEMERRLEEYAKLKTATKEVGEPCFHHMELANMVKETSKAVTGIKGLTNYLNTRASEYRLDGMKKALAKAAENATTKSEIITAKANGLRGQGGVWREISVKKSSITDPKNLDV